MKKYRVKTVARYFDEYVVEAENPYDATDLALDRANEDHEDADEVMRVDYCVRIDLDHNVVEEDPATS